MSWHYVEQNAPCSPVAAAESSGHTCSDSKPKSASNGTRKRAKYCSVAKSTDCFPSSRFGTISKHSTAGHGAERSTWFQADFPVRTFQQLAGALVSKAKSLVCGEKWRGLSVKFDPDSSSWKTVRCLFPEDLDWSCLTLPNWGSFHDGELWELATLDSLTDGIAFGFMQGIENGDLVFPTASTKGIDGGSNSRAAAKKRGAWATPSARDWKDTPGMSTESTNPDGSKRKRTDQLARQIYADKETFPTPMASEAGKSEHTLGLVLDGSSQMTLDRFCRLYPTPTATLGSKGGLVTPAKSKEGGNLIEAVANVMFPTPRAGKTSDEEEASWQKRKDAGNVSTPPLALAVKMYPTPTAKKGGADTPETKREGGPDLQTAVRDEGEIGQLNPAWVCWLMGWPWLEDWDWTDLEPCPDVQNARDSVMMTIMNEPSGLPRVRTGIQRRTDRLRIIGNGQSPLAAFAAFTLLENLK